MAFPDPSNYGTDPGQFSGRDYALGRHYFGDGGGDDDGGGDGGGGCGCLIAGACIMLLLPLIVGLISWIPELLFG